MAATKIDVTQLSDGSVGTNQVVDAAITNAKLAGSIATSKLADASNTPGANKVVVADGAGKLPSGWGGVANSMATLDGGSILVQAALKVRSVAPSTASGELGVDAGDLKFGEGANVRIVENTSRKNTANGYAGLDGSGRVTPANVPTLNAIQAPIADVGLNGQKLVGVAEPTQASDAATKNYVDSVAQGLRIKPNAAVATTAALADAYTGTATTLTKSSNGPFPANIDGVATQQNMTILVKNEAGALEKYNGWYTLSAVGSAGAPWVLTRIVEADTNKEISEGSYGWVESGSQGNTRWVVSSGPAVLGTDPVTFTQLGGAMSSEAGAGLVVGAGGVLDVNADGTTLEVVADQVRIKDGGVSTAKLGDGQVTYQKMQNVGSARIVGRISAGAGVAEELTASGGIEFSGSGIRREALTGDVTAAAGSNATTVANGAITAAKTSGAVQARLGGACDVQEFLAQAADGVRTRFDLLNSDVDGTATGLQLFKNGILMEIGSGNDYTFGDGTGTGGKDEVIMASPPATGTKLIARYRRTGLVG